MIREWIEKAEKGEAVWVGDVREELAQTAGTKHLALRLQLSGGAVRIFTLQLPEAKDGKEKKFLSDWVKAEVYNILSALGGEKLTFCCGREEQMLKDLAEETAAAFEAPDSPYNRILRELNRMCRFTGAGRFTFDYAEETGEETAGKKTEKCLPEILRAAAETAMRGTRAGIDVGGTDIKSVLSVDGRLVCTREYDWNPAASETAEGIIAPVLEELAAMLQGNGEKADSIGLSYPDVCIRNRICGGETPKTMGIRNNKAVDYEEQFGEITGINERLAALCKENASVRITNDGNIAAYTAAMETAHSGNDAAIENGCLAHALGTSLGTGWVNAEGMIPENPLEFYDFIIDIGSYPQRAIQPEDLRSVRNENSRLTGADRYVGQASAFRYARELAPELLEGYATEEDGLLLMPGDRRKACLEHLMQEAESGTKAAEETFRQVGRAFAQVSREMCRILQPETDSRCLFGRFVKKQRCYALIKEGFEETLPEIRLSVADESTACSPLMKQLSGMEGKTVAQFGQAVGALYFGC